MFEKFIAPVINKILGDYVGNLESKQLSVGIWQGDVALHNLKLKKEALDKFNLPIEVVEGYLGDLTLSIPWNDLKNKPVKIFINHVYILARPKAAGDYDPVEEEENAQKAKLAKLETAEMLQSRSKEPHIGLFQNSKGDSNFMAQLITKIVDNVQISMKNIHIRYEDSVSNPKCPFSVGVTMEELSAVSCNGNWEETFLHDQTDVINKLVKLASLAVYFNTQPKSFTAGSSEQFMENFQRSIATSSSLPDGYQYILKPVSGNAKIETHKVQPASGARHTAALDFEELAFLLDKEQFINSISLLGAFSSYLRSKNYRQFRPPRTISPSLDPEAWLKFAGRSVLHDIQERNRRLTWTYLAERRDDRHLYVTLYKQRKESTLSPEEQVKSAELERKLSFEDIMLYRSIAMSQLRKSPKYMQSLVAAKEAANTKPSTWGNLSNWWSGKAHEQTATESNSMLSDEQMKQLYETIEFDPAAVSTPEADLPPDAALITVRSLLKRGSLTLRNSPGSGENVLISLVFQDFQAAVTQYVAAIAGKITLGNMTLNDRTTPNSLYPTLIRAKNHKQDGVDGQVSLLSICFGRESYVFSDVPRQLSGPFFTMELEHNPLDGRADDAVSIVMLPLEVIYNPVAIKTLVSFFTPPKSESDTIYTIQAAAQGTFEGLTAQTKATLEYAVADHKTLDLKIDFAAPIFLLPQSCTDVKSMVMLVDAGHFLLASNYINKEKKRELQQKHGALRSAEDLGELTSLLYDRFTCELSAVQVLIGQSVETCMQQASSDTPDGNLHLIERVSVSFCLEICILPKLLDFTKMRIVGNLPRLHLNVSDRKYKTMMTIIDLVLASFPNSDAEAAQDTLTDHQSWNILDSRPALNFVSVDDDGESFYDAPEDIARDTRSEVTDDSVNRVAMEIKFEVDHASVSLMKSDRDPTLPDRVLAELSVEHFGIGVRNLTHEMQVKIKIRSVEIEDRMQPGEPAFRYLLSPSIGGDQISVASDNSAVDQLIRVSYVGTKPTSPDYNGVDQSLDVSFAAVTVVLTSSSVLMLYDFILSTFTSPPNAAAAQKAIASPESTEVAQVDAAPAKTNSIVVHANMKSINFIINQDGTRIATMQFGELDTTVRLHGETMIVDGSIGNLAVVDDIPRVQNRQFNQLLQIEGDEVAHFTWQTFDPKAADYPGYDSSLTLRASSMRFTYIESLLHGLIAFFSKFQKMHALLESARRAAIESAQQLQQAAGKFHYDIEIQSPVLVFPRTSLQSKDRLSVFPGSVSAKNTFRTDGHPVDKIDATVRSMKLLTVFESENGGAERQMLDDININMVMETQPIAEHRSPIPDSIVVDVSDVHMRLTAKQYEFLLTLADSLRTFTDTATPTADETGQKSIAPADAQPEETAKSAANARQIKLVLPSVCLEVLHSIPSSATPTPLVRFAIHETLAELNSHGTESTTQVSVRSFSITDTREESKNLFKEIMPSSGRKEQQLKVDIISNEGGSQIAATLNAATLILVPDHAFLVRSFFLAPLQDSASSASAATPEVQSTADPTPSPQFCLDLIDVEVLLLHDASNPSTEAIVLGAKKLSVDQHELTKLSVDDLGMFLCQMGKREETSVPFIQNFHAKLNLEQHKNVAVVEQTQISVDLSPIVLRVSYRDVLLIMDIFNGIHELVIQSDTVSTAVVVADQDPGSSSPVEIVKPVGERLHAVVQGFRLLLIDDLNDLHLPMVDLVMDKLMVDVANWSSAMRLETAPALHINYFNVTSSHWEPLVEQWQFFITMAKPTAKGTLSLEFFAKRRLEINVTHTMVETVLNTMQLLDKQGRRALTAKRGMHSPYVLKNRTGYNMYVWTDSTESGLDTEVKMLNDGDELPWRFEDWRMMREGTSPVLHRISLQIDGSSWETVKEISVDSEGVKPYALRPAVQRVEHRLVCEVKLVDNVKVVTFRSGMGIRNSTTVPLNAVIVNSKKQRGSVIANIAPGEDYYVPIEAAYHDMIQIRPQEGLGYDWSNELLYWKDMQKKLTSLIACRSSDPTAPSFRFQVNAVHAGGVPDPTYPGIIFELLPPFQLENLLPYNIRYKLYDRTDRSTRAQPTETLREGSLHPVHTIDPTHLIAMGIEIVDSAYLPSEVAIITHSDLDYRDETLKLSDNGGQQLLLRLKYSDKLSSGGPKISIYSPYVVLNKTGLDMSFSTRSLMGVSRYASPAAVKEQGLRPVLFSFPNFEPVRSRVQIKTAGSDWSKPISFDAVGSGFDIAIQNPKTRTESHVGVSVKEGEGKYFMTKVVTFAPRFILKNHMEEEIQIRQRGATAAVSLKTNESVPLHDLKLVEGAQHDVCVRLTGLMNEWSNPFDVNQLGRVYIKMGRMSSPEQDLVRAEVLLQDATIFVIIAGRETRWPFKIENKTDIDLDIWQHGAKMRFKVPAGESRPYAWDYPSAPRKALILSAKGREREIDVLEIGQLVPFKYPGGIMAMHVLAEGPTIVVKLSAYVESKSAFKNTANALNSIPSERETKEETFQMKIKESKLLMAVQVRFEGIGISVINKSMQELLYLSARKINLALTDTTQNQALAFDMKWLQIDNQLYGGLEPIFVYPSVIPKEGEEDFHPVLMLTFSRSKDTSYGVDYYDWFTILLQELSVDLDEEFLMSILDFAKFNVPGWDHDKSKLCDTNIEIQEPPITNEAHRMYFEKFLLQPVQINVSFVRTQNVNIEEARPGRRGVLSFVLDVLTMTLGNIHDAPLRLNALELRHPNVTPNQLLDSIFTHYQQELVGQVHKIIGSADFLGNPVGLFNNVSSGVSDFFYEPLQGFEITRPQDFGIGVAKGTASLFRKTVFGVSDTFSKFTGSIGKGLSVITMDTEFQERRRISSIRNRPRHAVYGVTNGATSLARSVASGISGVVSKPFEGAQEEGVGGFFKGLGKGIVGVVTKPVIGVIDLATNVGEGIRNTTTVFDTDLDRTRLPRFIGKDKVLAPYNTREALGLNWLKGMENGKFFHEDYVWHLSLPRTGDEDLVVLVTDQRVLMSRIKRLRIDWEIPFTDMQSIRVERTSVNITRKSRDQARSWSILCPDAASAQALCKKIEEAIFDSTDKSRSSLD
ncbi:hypothetical protein HKX48_004689 [Thoreauomyces humboldtii]|nr:hypothetical protein HKX48_004689 [Thoreauomyces humboldtii]